MPATQVQSTRRPPLHRGTDDGKRVAGDHWAIRGERHRDAGLTKQGKRNRFARAIPSKSGNVAVAKAEYVGLQGCHDAKSPHLICLCPVREHAVLYAMPVVDPWRGCHCLAVAVQRRFYRSIAESVRGYLPPSSVCAGSHRVESKLGPE